HGGHMSQHQARASLDGADLAGSPGVVQLETAYVLDQTLEAWQHAALEAVRAAPADRGAYVTDVAAAVGRAGCPGQLRRAVIDRVCAQQHLHAHGDILTDPAATATYLDARARRQAAVVEAMSHDPLSPPDLGEITRTVQVVGTELQGLFDDGRLVQTGDVVM